MKIDIARQLAAVSRMVKHLEHDGEPARAVLVSRTYDIKIEDLWDAITSAERIPRWFLPVSGELRLGGRFQLEGNAGGEITRCEPPCHLAVTWEFADQTSWLELTLTEDRAAARLELKHVAMLDEHWERFGPGATGVGWEGALAGLDLHLTTGATVNPEEAMTWMMSAEGKSFYRQSSEAWGRADIACGAEPAAATAAAARTAAFYTGEDDGSEHARED